MVMFIDKFLYICASIKYDLLMVCQSHKKGSIQIMISVQIKWLVTFANDDDGYVDINPYQNKPIR